jgi:hypothetical protein
MSEQANERMNRRTIEDQERQKREKKNYRFVAIFFFCIENIYKQMKTEQNTEKKEKAKLFFPTRNIQVVNHICARLGSFFIFLRVVYVGILAHNI